MNNKNNNPDTPDATPVLARTYAERLGRLAAVSFGGVSAVSVGFALPILLAIIGYYLLTIGRIANQALQKINAFAMTAWQSGNAVEAGLILLGYCATVAIICGIVAYLSNGYAEHKRLQQLRALGKKDKKDK